MSTPSKSPAPRKSIDPSNRMSPILSKSESGGIVVMDARGRHVQELYVKTALGDIPIKTLVYHAMKHLPNNKKEACIDQHIEQYLESENGRETLKELLKDVEDHVKIEAFLKSRRGLELIATLSKEYWTTPQGQTTLRTQLGPQIRDVIGNYLTTAQGQLVLSDFLRSHDGKAILADGIRQHLSGTNVPAAASRPTRPTVASVLRSLDVAHRKPSPKRTNILIFDDEEDSDDSVTIVNTPAKRTKTTTAPASRTRRSFGLTMAFPERPRTTWHHEHGLVYLYYIKGKESYVTREKAETMAASWLSIDTDVIKEARESVPGLFRAPHWEYTFFLTSLAYHTIMRRSNTRFIVVYHYILSWMNHHTHAISMLPNQQQTLRDGVENVQTNRGQFYGELLPLFQAIKKQHSPDDR